MSQMTEARTPTSNEPHTGGWEYLTLGWSGLGAAPVRIHADGSSWEGQVTDMNPDCSTPNGNLAWVLNWAGSAGWELVSLNVDHESYHVAAMKRPRPAA